MDSLLPHRPSTSPRILDFQWRPILADATAERRDTSRTYNLVPPRTLARRLLALVVRCHHSSDPFACPPAHPRRGRKNVVQLSGSDITPRLPLSPQKWCRRDV